MLQQIMGQSGFVGHYAEKHHGMCLGFDIPEESKSVEYITKPKESTLDEENDSPPQKELDPFFAQALWLKFNHWEYESEVRMYVRLDHDAKEAGRYFYSFCSDLILREVILGARCELPIAKMQDLIKHYDPSPEIIKTKLDYSEFKIYSLAMNIFNYLQTIEFNDMVKQSKSL
jgi:hypothetical protein